MNAPPERASCSRGSRCVVFAVAGFLLVLACTMQATAQKPRLKLLDYGKWGNSIGVQCRPGPLYIDDTLEVKPGTLVDNGEIYSTDSWYMSHASTVADVDRFRERKVDTIDVGSWEFFDDSVRSRLQDAMGKLGRFRLVSRGSMSFFRDPRLYYKVIFDEPVKYAVAEATFKNQGIYKYPQFAFEGIGACIIPTIVPNDRVFDPRRTTEYKHNNGSLDDYFPATAHSRTHGWSLYSIKAPMAWTVTMGHKDVIIGTHDFQTGCDELNNDDLEKRIDGNGLGNVREIYGTATAAFPGKTANFGDGIDRSTLPLASDFNVTSGSSQHSIECLTAAIGKADNDNLADPLSGPEGSAVGSAPKCNGMYFPWQSATECNGFNLNDRIASHCAATDLDLDFEDNSVCQRVDVMYHSYVSNTPLSEDVTAKRGLIVVASAGNATSAAFVNYVAATQFLHPTNADQDTKVIAVAATMDGNIFAARDCSPWTSASPPPPVWIGNERIRDGWNFSPDSDKFNNSTNVATRQAAKEDAFVDLVAPGTDIWVARNTDTKYGMVNGTSLSGPLVAGVIGLMLSVSDHLGTEWDDVEDRPLDWGTTDRGRDHQRRAYDLLTFTADKLPDGNSLYPYRYQTNDKLKRHWAQRMGFGKVNAYRAVAHAVPHKGAYEFTASETLNFDANVTNPDGKMLMHFGSQVHHAMDLASDNTRGGGNTGLLNVLEWGGTNLLGPYSTTEYQNQGVTRISSSNVSVRTDLTVPEDCLLLIDGRLLTEENEFTQSQNRIIATADGSRILMEGYLQNVELVGALTLGDLIVDGTDLAPGLFSNRESDVYGNVRLLNDSWWTICGNPGNKATTLRTGSHVELNGSRNLLVRWGGILEMDHSSRISTNQNRVVLVENGMLRVKPGAKVRFDAHVHIWDGQTFEIGDSAVVYIKSMNVNKGATFRVKPGAHVIFGADEVVINGHFDAQGGSGGDRYRIVFTPEIDTCVGGVNTNCTFDPRNHQYIQRRTRVKIEGMATQADVMQSSVKASYCDFKNVSLEMKNVRTDAFVHDRFTAHRNSPTNVPGNVWSAQPFMVQYESSKHIGGLPPSFYRLSVSNCSFIDSAGVVAPRNAVQDDYLIRGIYCVNGRSMEVKNSTFDNLAMGLSVHDTPATQLAPNLVEENTLRECDAGMHIGLGAYQVCKNTTNRVRVPINGYNLDISRYYDNTFAASRVAVYFLNCLTQAFRNNDFFDYWTGIRAEGSIVSLTSLYEAGFGTPIQTYGRNRFAVANPAPFNLTFGVGHPNPFTLVGGVNWAQEVALLSDLQYNVGTQYLIKCGYNAFSQFATSHLSAPWIPLQIVDGSFNEFRPNAMARGTNVAIGGNPWNVSQGYSQVCGIEYETSTCVSFSIDGDSVFGKRRLDDSESSAGSAYVPMSTATYVYEQATATVDALGRKIHMACNGTPAEATYEVHGVTGQARVASNVPELFTHLQTVTPGIFSLRVYNPQTATCSVLILVVR